jgi:hypothetical protein
MKANSTASDLAMRAEDRPCRPPDQQHRCHHADERRQAVGPDVGALIVAEGRHAQGLQPMDADRLLVARGVLKADVDEVARLQHLFGGLGEAGFVAVGHGQRGLAGDVKRKAPQQEDGGRPHRAGAEPVEGLAAGIVEACKMGHRRGRTWD